MLGDGWTDADSVSKYVVDEVLGVLRQISVCFRVRHLAVFFDVQRGIRGQLAERNDADFGVGTYSGEQQEYKNVFFIHV